MFRNFVISENGKTSGIIVYIKQPEKLENINDKLNKNCTNYNNKINNKNNSSYIDSFFNYLSMGVILSLTTFLIGCLIIFFIKNNEQNN